MLIGILGLVTVGYTMTGQIRFDYNYLMGVANMLDTQAPAVAYAFMICLFIGFAVKLPVFPLHGWLPDAHAQAPTAGSVDLAGILIKTAAYGLIRFVIPFFPAASARLRTSRSFFGFNRYLLRCLVCFPANRYETFIGVYVYFTHGLRFTCNLCG